MADDLNLSGMRGSTLFYNWRPLVNGSECFLSLQKYQYLQ